MTSTDGGRWALAGFLYQLTASWGVTIRVLDNAIEAESDDLDVLLAMSGIDGSVRHEVFGQDLSVGDNELILFQFKYSTTKPTRPLGLPELRKIVDAFGESIRLVHKAGQSVTKVVLVTNRRPTSPAARLIKQVQAGSQPTAADRGRCATLRKLHAQWKSDLAEHYELLRDCSRHLGVLEEEFKGCVDRLLGELLSSTAIAGSPSITRQDIVRCFTGHVSANTLRWSELQPTVATRVQSFLSFPVEHLFRRDLLSDIAAACNQRALITLFGLGGTGKSTALYLWSCERTSMISDSEAGFAAITSALSTPPNWLSSLSSEWQGLPPGSPRRTESFDKALKRLTTANPHAGPPVLCLALDGLDEGRFSDEHRHVLQDLLHWFWKEDCDTLSEGRPPRATLLVTAREQHAVEEFLLLDVDGFGAPAADHRIEIGDFTEQELLEVARFLEPTIYATVENALLAADTTASTSLPLSAPSISATMTTAAADLDVIRAIRHPAMWRAFFGLPAETQRQALEGLEAARYKMAETFVKRFCKKARQRDRTAGLNEREVWHILSAIATATGNLSPNELTSQRWRDTARSTELVSDAAARRLFAEAEIGGLLVRTEIAQWRWRENLTAGYLAASTNPYDVSRSND